MVIYLCFVYIENIMGKEEQLKKRRDGLKKQLEKMKKEHPNYSKLKNELLFVKYELDQIKQREKSLNNHKPKAEKRREPEKLPEGYMTIHSANEDRRVPKKEQNVRLPPLSNKNVMPVAALQRENDIKQEGFFKLFRNQFNPLSSLTKEQRNLMSLDEIRSVNDVTRTKNEDMLIEQSNNELEANKKKAEQLDKLNKQFINGAVQHLTGVKVNAVEKAKQGKELYNGATDTWLKVQDKSNSFNNHRSLLKTKHNVLDDVSDGISSPAGDFVSNTLQWGKNPFTMVAGIAEGLFMN